MLGLLGRSSRLLVPAALVASLFTARGAHAESAPARPSCRVQLLPPPGSNVPANLPALVVDQTNTSPGLTSSIAITKISGGTTPLTLGQVADPKDAKTILLVPSTNDLLEAGTTYTIDYTAKCSNGDTDRNTSSSFVAGPAVALPTSIGSAKVAADGKVTITPSPELAAFIATTRFEVFLDDASVGTTRYGVFLEGTVAPRELEIDVSRYGINLGFQNVLGSLSVCTSKAVEKHEIGIVAHVAGAEGDTAALSFSVDIDCSKEFATPVILPDAGGDDRGASGGSADDQGCSVGGPGPMGRLAGIFLAGAGVAVLFRRRRR